LENNNTGSSRLTNKETEYILVSNARIGNFTARDRIFPFKDLRESIKNEIRLIPGINDTFLQKTFLMIGPVPEDIKNLVVGAAKRLKYGEQLPVEASVGESSPIVAVTEFITPNVVIAQTTTKICIVRLPSIRLLQDRIDLRIL
jgi:hypothetical protein